MKHKILVVNNTERFTKQLQLKLDERLYALEEEEVYLTEQGDTNHWGSKGGNFRFPFIKFDFIII